MPATRMVSQQAVPRSRIYAIRELARRAGVRDEFFDSWQFASEDAWTVVRVGPEGAKRIRFPEHGAASDTRARLEPSAPRALWAHAPGEFLSRRVADFVVPFESRELHNRPVFLTLNCNSVEFQFDLPTSALLTLSRREEDQPALRDTHGRFPAAASIATKFNFLHRPIVDEYGLALEQALRFLIPAWEPVPRSFRVKLSHDIDDVGIPFGWRTAAGHLLARKNPSAFARDLLSRVSGGNTAYLAAVERLAALSKEYGLDSAFYWKGSKPGPFDTGYAPSDPRVQAVIARLAEQGIECGVHPGYETYDAPERLASEIGALRTALGRTDLGGRQHYLRWKPDTWRHWEACGLAYDSTVGFADELGFRAGTSLPYRPWLFSEGREANLTEIPLIAMDCTPVCYMGLSVDESFERVMDCAERCRMFGGVFTLLWHNTTVLDPRYGSLYTRLLAKLSGAKRFDWREAAA